MTAAESVTAGGLVAEIEAALKRRTGRESLYVPSGRLALYLAFRAYMAPGDALLMSPVNDDVILFCVLAAGLRPVMAPLSSADGNIAPAAVSEDTWASVAGVLTTNLYGQPDRVVELRDHCERGGLVLIEDAAHAVETSIAGSSVGTFGAAAGFSLAKHVGAKGGVLAIADPDRRPELERLRTEALATRSGLNRLAMTARPYLRKAVHRLRLQSAAQGVIRASRRDERTEHRMPLEPDALRAALRGEPGLDRFDPWIRVDQHDYRLTPSTATLERAVAGLQELPAARARRLAGTQRVREEVGEAAMCAADDAVSLFRVPVFVKDRDALARELARLGIEIDYVYDPPLDDYAGDDFVTPSSDPTAARLWSRHVLPIDPLKADATLAALRRVPGGVRWESPQTSEG